MLFPFPAPVLRCVVQADRSARYSVCEEVTPLDSAPSQGAGVGTVASSTPRDRDGVRMVPRAGVQRPSWSRLGGSQQGAHIAPHDQDAI